MEDGSSPTSFPSPSRDRAGPPSAADRVAIVEALVGWYRANRRDLPWRDTGDPFRIWLSEVMLQQTRVETVLPYYERFLSRFPDLGALARADLQTVLKLWEGLGYYARARNFHRACGMVVDLHGGRVPDDPALFRRLPGVGEYICSAVMSIAFGRPLAVVDGNVKRVLSRWFLLDAPANTSAHHPVFRGRAESLLDRERPGTFNQALMELGALVCKPRKPVCGECPAGAFCAAGSRGLTDRFPARVKKAAVPRHLLAAGVVFHGGRVLLVQRKPEGLLGGLWEFPNGRREEGETPEAACVRTIQERTGLRVDVDGHVDRVRHAYTHFRIIMDVFRCTHLSGRVRLREDADHCWVPPDQVRRYPMPKAHIKFLHRLGI